MSPKRAEESDDKYVIAREILSRLGDRWSVLIIYMINGEPVRFTELKRKVEEVRPISSRVLTRTLKQLERDGLVTRKAFPVVPPRVEYKLTPLGQRFLNFAMEILDWTIEYRADFEAARQEFESQATRQ
jgi:DNA-binding HxlR family transcriptional regulator